MAPSDSAPRSRPEAAKYSSDQPRVPAGNPDGGQWTSGVLLVDEAEEKSTVVEDLLRANESFVLQQRM